MITFFEANFENPDEDFSKNRKVVDGYIDLLLEYLNYETYVLQDFDSVKKRVDKIVKLNGNYEGNWLRCLAFLKTFLKDYFDRDLRDDAGGAGSDQLEFIRNFYKRGNVVFCKNFRCDLLQWAR
jgi:hypothetical protein